MHVIYNLAGSLLFVLLSLFIPLPEIVQSMFPDNVKLQIGALNVIFNGASAIIALILPIKKKKQDLHFVSPMVKYSR